MEYGITLSVKPEKIFVIDTNVLISDPQAIEKLQGDGKNVVIVPFIVLRELDNLKHTKSHLMKSISAAMKNIIKCQHNNDPLFFVAQGNIKNFPELNQNQPDDQIIATYLEVRDRYPSIPNTIISIDGGMHALAKALKLEIQEYEANKEDTSIFEHPLPHLPMSDFGLCEDGIYYSIKDGYDFPDLQVPENGGVVLMDKKTKFVCIREGDLLRAIRSNISALNITPHTLIPEETNWEMYLALEQLSNPKISCTFLIGKAGTGKTLLAIAAAIKQVKDGKADRILIARPYVRTSDRKDQLGFLPGGLEEKASPWLKPIYDNIDFLCKESGNAKVIKDLQSKERLEVLSFDQVRGRTLNNARLILDEAQNATHEDMITILSRLGSESRVFVTGDVEQIDIYPQDKRINALSHAVIDLMDEPNCANTYLVQPARSMFASLIAAKLRRS